MDITGTQDLVRQEPVIRLTKMMTREDPIYHGLLPAGGEHKMLMGVPYEPLIFKAVSKVAKVNDVELTQEDAATSMPWCRLRRKRKPTPGVLSKLPSRRTDP